MLRDLSLLGFGQGIEDAKPVIEALKSNGITKIAAAGFCWGAKVVVELAKHAYILAGLLLHPSVVRVKDIQDQLLREHISRSCARMVCEVQGRRLAFREECIRGALGHIGSAYQTSQVN